MFGAIWMCDVRLGDYMNGSHPAAHKLPTKNPPARATTLATPEVRTTVRRLTFMVCSLFFSNR